MLRPSFVIAAALLVLAGCSGTPTPAPAPATTGGGGGPGPSTGELYFPFVDGGQWMYNVSIEGNLVGQMREEHSLVANGANARSAHVSFVGHIPWGHPTGIAQEDFAFRQLQDKIVSQDETGQETQLLALPLADGTSWQMGGLPLKVDGREDVTVPAGTYADTLRITGGNGVTAWLAQGIGVVKLQIGERNGVAPVTTELATFTP